jgi:hypothetical protein
MSSIIISLYYLMDSLIIVLHQNTTYKMEWRKYCLCPWIDICCASQQYWLEHTCNICKHISMFNYLKAFTVKIKSCAPSVPKYKAYKFSQRSTLVSLTKFIQKKMNIVYIFSIFLFNILDVYIFP